MLFIISSVMLYQNLLLVKCVILPHFFIHLWPQKDVTCCLSHESYFNWYHSFIWTPYIPCFTATW